MTRLLIVGGSDAGISAGLRARQVDPAVDVQLVLADSFPNFSICGLPFFVSGETPDWRSLAHRNLDQLTNAGLGLLMNAIAEEVDAKAKQVIVHDSDGAVRHLRYDRLVLATGAEPVRPDLPGLHQEGVHVLHTMQDSFAVRSAVDSGARSALIVGGGYIGLEMADAFSHRGMKVTLVEMADQVMTTVDDPLAELIVEELRRNDVEVVLGTRVERVEREASAMRLQGSGDFERTGDLVLVVVGVRPNSDLAKAAGVATGARGAIKVSPKMETNLSDVFAAGDCVETHHRLLAEPTYMPLGTTAHKQGRVAGENAAGGTKSFPGCLGTQVVKVFDLAVARTGLRDQEARLGGFDPLTVQTEEWDHKAYYPGAHRLHMRVTGDRKSGRLLGAQIVGDHRAQVAKRIDIFAAALYSGLSVSELLDLDLSYTPPFAAPWDAVQVAAHAWLDES